MLTHWNPFWHLTSLTLGIHQLPPPFPAIAISIPTTRWIELFKSKTVADMDMLIVSEGHSQITSVQTAWWPPFMKMGRNLELSSIFPPLISLWGKLFNYWPSSSRQRLHSICLSVLSAWMWSTWVSSSLLTVFGLQVEVPFPPDLWLCLAGSTSHQCFLDDPVLSFLSMPCSLPLLWPIANAVPAPPHPICMLLFYVECTHWWSTSTCPYHGKTISWSQVGWMLKLNLRMTGGGFASIVVKKDALGLWLADNGVMTRWPFG